MQEIVTLPRGLAKQLSFWFKAQFLSNWSGRRNLTISAWKCKLWYCYSFFKCCYQSILDLELSLTGVWMPQQWLWFGDCLEMIYIFVDDPPAWKRQGRLGLWSEQWSGVCGHPRPQGTFSLYQMSDDLNNTGELMHSLLGNVNLSLWAAGKRVILTVCQSNRDLRYKGDETLRERGTRWTSVSWKREVDWGTGERVMFPALATGFSCRHLGPEDCWYHSICFASASLFVCVNFQLSNLLIFAWFKFLRRIWLGGAVGPSIYEQLLGHMSTMSQSAVSRGRVPWYRTWLFMLQELYGAPSLRDVTYLCIFMQMGHECGRHWDVLFYQKMEVMINPMNIQESLKFRHDSLGCDSSLNWHTLVPLSSYLQVNLWNPF